MIHGKLAPSGVLTDMTEREPLTYGDGSTDVPLVSMPDFFGPFGYDAVNKVAIPNQTQAAFDLEQQRVQAMEDNQWLQVDCYLAADVTTTLAAQATDLPGLSFPIGANETWNGEFKIFCTGNSGGVRFVVIGPPNPALAVAGFDGNSTSVSARTFNPKFAFAQASIAYCVNSVAFLGSVIVNVHVVNGPTPGVVQLQFASGAAGQLARVHGGSFGTARRAA